MNGSLENPGVLNLRQLGKADAHRVGTKAAHLGELLHADFDVPEGVVVLGLWTPKVFAAIQGLGAGPFAVRSSSAAEDLGDASYAGLYETCLNISSEPDLRAAVDTCRKSATAERVVSYAGDRQAPASVMPVVVQPMVRATAAGVAFTVNPVTGARDEVSIVANRGLGEAVVSGAAVGEEWISRSGSASCLRSAPDALNAGQAQRVADTAKRIEALFGAPQDIEWAFEGDRLRILQARPMTAVPDAVSWTPPSPGHWMRNFRVGEWLSAPMTPLFEDWLLPRIEEGYLRGMLATAGATVPFRYAAINGWYYTTTPRFPPWVFLRALIASRGKIIGVLINALFRVGRDPVAADRRLLGGLAEQWERELLPRYRATVADKAALVEGAPPEALVATVDELGLLAGEALWSLAIVGGAAWKMEARLAAFIQEYARAYHQGAARLLQGLEGVHAQVEAHAVQSLDWFFPTAGEMGWANAGPPAPVRAALTQRRQDAEFRVQQAMTAQARVALEALLRVTRRYSILREEQSAALTLAWPALRRCVLRLGEDLRRRGAIAQVEDVFFVRREELGAVGPIQDVASRRARWTRQRRLPAPLAVGRRSKLLEAALHGAVSAARVGAEQASARAAWGHPASPGVATGPVRLVRGPEDFAGFKTGDVLVAAGTAPAWTPLFARAAAVVTDGGSLAAHASLVAREYGIPAVVGMGDATRRFAEGQVVTVNGSAGFVEPMEK